jgi:hypothetical protein
MTLYVIHDIGPNLINLGAKLMGVAEDLKTALNDLKETVIVEAEQVNAKLDLLATKIGETVDSAAKAELLAMVANIKADVAGIIPDEPPA